MRMSRFHAPTLREAPRDAELPSHELLIRAGFIRQVTAGVYNLLPLGLRTVRKIAAIVREEMDDAGAQEVLMPTVQPAELWEESGRWKKYGPELLRFKDRKGNDGCLGPTHEEVIVDLVRRDVRSYKQLPMNLYQIQGKFRDEIRPRGGLMRGREFLMKDAYSFDVDFDTAKASYQAMYDAYFKIFERCGLDFRPVEADAGNIGGSMTHEFQVLAETGEDAIVSCSKCDYAANVEMAELPTPEGDLPTAGDGAPELVDTPGKKTVAEVTEFLGVQPAQLLKTLICVARFGVGTDDETSEVVAAIVRGDRELNVLKVKRALQADVVDLADDETVTKVTGAPVGYAGPVGLEIPVLIDPEAARVSSAVCGGNAADKHYTGVFVGRDFDPKEVVDLRMAVAGDPCPRCDGELRAFRGIEVGHVFLLGTQYSEPMGCTFLDKNGKSAPMVMGCYGIGVTRIMAAAIEQRHDDKGIKWPVALAPFQCAVLSLGKPGDVVTEAAADIYDGLKKAGVETIFDERKERAGVKFADAELIGFPIVVVLGKRGLDAGQVEVKVRAEGSKQDVPIERLADWVSAKLEELRGQ